MSTRQCEECKGEVVYDPIHDESVCSDCGLVQGGKEPKIEHLPVDFKADFLLMHQNRGVVELKRWYELTKEDIQLIRDHPTAVHPIRAVKCAGSVPVEFPDSLLCYFPRDKTGGKYWEEVEKTHTHKDGIGIDTEPCDPLYAGTGLFYLFKLLQVLSWWCKKTAVNWRIDFNPEPIKFKGWPIKIVPRRPEWIQCGRIHDIQKWCHNRIEGTTNWLESIPKKYRNESREYLHGKYYPKIDELFGGQISNYRVPVGENGIKSGKQKVKYGNYNESKIKYFLVDKEMAVIDHAPYLEHAYNQFVDYQYRTWEKGGGDPILGHGFTRHHVVWMDRVAATREELISLRECNPGLAAKMELASIDGATIKAGPDEEYPNPLYNVEGVFEQIPMILKGSGSSVKANIMGDETGIFGSYLHEHFNKPLIWKDKRNNSKYRCAFNTFRWILRLFSLNDPGPAPFRWNYQKITGIYPPDYSPEARKIHKTIMAEKAEAEARQTDAEMVEDKYDLDRQEHEEAYGYTRDYPGKDHAPISKNWKRGPFTHANFLRKSYRRCKRVYANKPLLEIARRPKKEQSECLVKWQYITKCAPGKDAVANVSECKGCPYAIESSLYEREHGIEGLIDGLNYPKQCFYTLGIIPWIVDPIPPRLLYKGEPCTIADTYGNEELAEFYKILDEWHGTFYPKTAKTVAVYRDNPDKPRPARVGLIPPYAHQIYANTPIGKLLKAASKPGRAMLYRLREYFQYALYLRRAHDNLFAWYQEPTRQKVIEVFMKCQRPYAVGYRHPADFIEKDQAEKYFSLLTEFKILKILDRLTRADDLIYATMKRIPSCSPRNPVEYYLDAQWIPRPDPGELGWDLERKFPPERLTEHDRAKMQIRLNYMKNRG